MDPHPSETRAPRDELATIHHDIAASPEQVWRALTTDDGLAPWMGDGASIEDAPGGEVVMPDVTTGRPRRGRVQSRERNRSLCYEWWPEDEPNAITDVSIELEPIEAGTRITVVERRAPRIGIAHASCAHITSVGMQAGASWAWRGALLAVAASRSSSTSRLAVA